MSEETITEAPAETTAPATTETVATEQPDWLSVFPEEARKDTTIARYKTPDELYKAIKSKDETISRKGVIIPKDDAPQAEKDKFYNDLGRPAKPEEYKFTTPANLHPSIKITPETESWFRKLAHEEGLTSKQADKINQKYLSEISAIQIRSDQAEQAAINAATTALRQEWAEKFDANQKLVINGWTKLGGQELIDSLGGEKGIGNNPLFLKASAKLFGSMSEDTFNALPRGGSPRVSGGETKEDAQAKINEVHNADKKTHPYFNEGHKDHQAALEEMTRLYRIVTGGN